MAKTFLGTGWSFPPKFNEHHLEVEMVSDDEDIRESLYILLSTRPGERITNLDYGCNLHNLVFDPINTQLSPLIVEAIRHAILFFEPRVTLNEVEVDLADDKEGLVYITIHYTVRKTNIRSNIVYPFYKIEGTNVAIN